jgi:DNA-directed RNA polymerase
MMSPIPESLVNEQVELERSQVSQGLKRLNDSTFKLEDKSYASATVYGIASIDTLLPRLVDKITITNRRIHEGHTGIAFKEIHKYLAGLEPLAAAAIACKITFDKVFSFKEGSNFAVNVCDSIGHAIEDECQMRHYENKVPALLTTLKDNYWHKSIGTQQKLVVIKTLMNRYDVPAWTPWGRSIRVKLGGWLLDCIMESSGWFTHQKIREGHKTVTYVLPTAEFLDIKDEVMATAELFSPLAWPMLVPPKDWSNEEVGGYILNEVMCGHDLVRRGDRHRIQGETPLDFLNKIQKVGYKLNPFIVRTAEFLQEKEISVGKFLPIIHYDLPPKPVDIAENKESRKNYRRQAAEVLNRQAQETRRSCRTRMTMEAVKKFKDRDVFYIPWSFDYRGRAYPIPAFLTPQDTDFGKSLIKFASESDVTPESYKWLAFQVATSYGLDKHTWDERQQWVKDNIVTITRVAKDPIDNIGDWEGAEEPWQFLAACEEYYRCVIIKDRLTTGLCVATDATCSGLQILAGLARDKSTAQLVNVLPSDRPQDAYAVIAKKSMPNIPEVLWQVWDRKCCKRTVMTIPYNAKAFSNRAYIREALKEKGIEVDKDDLTITVRAVRDAMSQVVPGPMSVMKWIEDEVSKAIKRGSTELEWTTPSGFVVVQRLMKKKMETIDLKLLGRCRLKVATAEGSTVDRNRHKAATAPNLIHSLDASLLHLSVKRFNEPIALIHDSVLCRATDMSLLSTIVRETYMHLFADNDYLNTFAQQIGAETEPPIIGDLEPKSVIDSTYFFC